MTKKVIRVHFKDGAREDRFFRSYAAIFRSDIAEKIGACKGTVWNVVRKNNGRYENGFVVITKETIEEA